MNGEIVAQETKNKQLQDNRRVEEVFQAVR